MSTSASSVKADLRRSLREQRRRLPSDLRHIGAERMTVNLAMSAMFRSARRIAFYVPADGEIDTDAILDRALRLGKRCYLPVLSRITHDRLWFAPKTANTRYIQNRYGILEPIVPSRSLVRAQDLDLILLPLVAFDIQGNRLGMGGGFYDRSLEFLARRQRWRKPRLIGLAFDSQKVASLPRDPWDVPLDAVVTDRATYAVNF